MRPDRVWYVAYGSNLNEERFLRYIQGDHDHVGARDSTAPARSEWAVVPLQLRFAGASKRWNGGGVAFVDTDPAAQAHVRAWNITGEQFEDVFAQENRLVVGTPLDWGSIADEPVELGSTAYGQLVPLTPFLDFASPTVPALTFTWTTPRPTNPPHDSYRSTIANGLATNPALSREAIQAYLQRSIAT